MQQMSSRNQHFTDSVIRRMTRISNESGAINLAQGFPDFDPPKEMMDRLEGVSHEGPHQYPITMGAPNFRQAIARKCGHFMGRTIDPETEIVATIGSTEAMVDTLFALTNPGDRVVMFSPFFENYRAQFIMADCEPVFVPLNPPTFSFDLNVLEDAFRGGAKAIIICNPSNPSGKVFTYDELKLIADLCIRYDVYAIMDEVYKSDNIAAFFQYDQRFWDRLSVSAGVRAEYYRVNNHHREAETKIFGAKVPFRPVFRAGLNYQLADYSFIRASAGQGYRNPSINEKYLRKDIGGVGIYPNLGIKPEKGYNAELGFKQGYKIGNFQGFVDVAGFYTEYRDMVEFQFGLFNNAVYSMINSISDAIQMLTDGKGFGIGAQFHNVSKAQIYGMEISTNGVYDFNKNTKLFYNLGYVYTEPRDADYIERNEIEDLYTAALQMKEKSNTGKYLKYRPKHSFKATVDFQWKRINLGANFAWKSKILAVDYLMMDEREKQQQDLMDYVRTVLFGKSRGETLATYWKKHNTDYATVDLRFGVKATKEGAFQFMVNNLLNKEYSYRPMAVAAPRTFVVKMDITF